MLIELSSGFGSGVGVGVCVGACVAVGSGSGVAVGGWDVPCGEVDSDVGSATLVVSDVSPRCAGAAVVWGLVPLCGCSVGTSVGTSEPQAVRAISVAMAMTAVTQFMCMVLMVSSLYSLFF